MAIPFDQQFFVEKERNNKYEWLIFIITLILLGIHGLLFHWIPRYLRLKRQSAGLTHGRYFNFIKRWDSFTSCKHFTIFNNRFYYQPSLVLFCFVFVGMNIGLCFAEIKDIDYQGYMYAISKRISRIAVGNLPILLLSVMKHDLLTQFSGFQFDRLEFLHKWLSRWMWAMITVHLSLACYYWLSNNFLIMIIIPPQIFGFMAYGSLVLLTWTSLKFIRQWCYEFWLVQHRVFAFIMLFMSFIHNSANRASVLVSVHGLVIDRVLGKVMAHIHKRYSPTKCKSTFKILDSATVEVTIPVREEGYVADKWYNKLLGYKNWKAGQHVYLNVPKIKWLEYHPFTVASLASSNEMKLLIRVQKGFTRKLMRHLADIDHDEHEDDLVNIKTMFHGPYGAVHQPFISFDHCIFFGAGSGAAFTFPVCLDLLQQIEAKDEIQDFLFRPVAPKIRFVWAIKHLKNIIWFKHIFDQLAVYANRGRLIIDIYVTQENGGSSSSSSCNSIEEQIETSEVKLEQSSSSDGAESYELNSIGSNSKLLNNNQIYGEDSKSQSMDKERTVITTSTTITGNSTHTERKKKTNSDTIEVEYDLTNPTYNVYYGRPDISSIIQSHTNELSLQMSNSSSYKSLAVASCGPPFFTNLIKEQCQVARRVKGSPDVYCYTESF
ncbi:FRP1 [Candida metapsilosis]|uniref:ferric-chelate reductase (NADPH) n=1 Tax=Candida metapsilosis TaxID=273372 RepID=A0A8H7ZEX0_9ASCO|nr:FRP1 [Candida metapsilosis]